MILISLITVGVLLIVYLLSLYNRQIVVVKTVNSTGLSQKFAAVLSKNEKLELTESDINSIIDLRLEGSESLKSKVKCAYINIESDELKLNSVVHAIGHDFMVESFLKPMMNDGNIILLINKVRVDGINIPKSIVRNVIKKYLPKGTSLMKDGSINIGSKILSFDIENMTIANGKVSVTLKGDSSLPVNDEGGQGQNGAGGASASTRGSKNQTDTKIAMLKKTNSQLYSVLRSVKSSSSKNWVNQVISVNTKMISNPNGSFTSEINNTKTAYSKLSPRTNLLLHYINHCLPPR